MHLKRRKAMFTVYVYTSQKKPKKKSFADCDLAIEYAQDKFRRIAVNRVAIMDITTKEIIYSLEN